MKSRELIREALDGGATFVRNHGDEVLLKFPNGKILRVPQGGKQSEAAVSLKHKVRKYLRPPGSEVS